MGMSQKQIDAIAHSEARGNIWDGAVRSGKTFGWLLKMLHKVSTYTGAGGVVIIGKNRDSIYRNVFEPIELVPEFAPFRPFVQYRQGAATATIFGHKVHVIGANDAGSESRIRGMTLGLAFCDELTVLNQQFFKQLLARLSVPGAQFYATTNPDSPAHWLKKDYLDRINDIGWYYVHFTMDDNPSLTEEYKTSLKREYTGLWYKRFILGLWVSAEGAIYDMWDEDTHVIDPQDIPPIERVIALGIDYGTTHPTRGTLLGIGADKRLYALDEWHPARSTDAKLSADLWEKKRQWEHKGWTPEWTYVDPAAASFSLQLHEDHHPRLDTADNAVIDGIRTVASLLNNQDLRISSTCTELIQELPGYRWDDKASEKGDEKPIKELDDAVDSLRYAVYSSRWVWSRHITNKELQP